MIRSVLYLHPRPGSAQAVADLYRRACVLERAVQQGCIGAELQLPLRGHGPIMVTALWRDQQSYAQWLENPIRSASGDELAELVEDAVGPELHGDLYEVVIEAGERRNGTPAQ
jgi:quinol monooxygenase YgiN